VLLVKEEDNAEASASPNWIMKKDIGEIQVPQPPEGWMPSMPDGKRGENPLLKSSTIQVTGLSTCSRPSSKVAGVGLLSISLPTYMSKTCPYKCSRKRVINSWEFYYQGWEADLENEHQMEVQRPTLSPKNGKAILTMTYLRKWVL
jgi:hypothetical protein